MARINAKVGSLRTLLHCSAAQGGGTSFSLSMGDEMRNDGLQLQQVRFTLVTKTFEDELLRLIAYGGCGTSITVGL